MDTQLHEINGILQKFGCTIDLYFMTLADWYLTLLVQKLFPPHFQIIKLSRKKASLATKDNICYLVKTFTEGGKVAGMTSYVHSTLNSCPKNKAMHQMWHQLFYWQLHCTCDTPCLHVDGGEGGGEGGTNCYIDSDYIT